MIPERFQPVLADLAPLADRFAAAGHRLYLVGGVVRDLMAGRELGAHVDLDLTTDAHPPQIKQVLAGWADALWTQGERFGTIGARKADREYEITTHRAEVYTSDSRKPDVSFAEAIESDLSRRDFTVNAMALEVTSDTPALVDPFGGAIDLLVERRLRTPLAPEISFSDDPLRMLRAARFIAGYALEPAPELVAAVGEMAARLEIVSAERIRDEFDKLMTLDHPAPGLWFLVDTGLAEQFLPELPAMRLEQDPIHRHKDVLAHTIAVVENVRPDAKAADVFDDRRLPPHAAGRPVPRRRQAAHPRLPQGQGRHVPPPRRGRGAHDPRPDAGAALLERRRARRERAGRPPPAVPHLQDGLDRLGGAPLRARRRRPPHRAQRAHPLRLHHPQRAQGPRAGGAGWTSWRRASSS